MYVPKQWLLPLALSFLLALAVVWLFGQNAALEAKVDAMESADAEIDELEAALAEPSSSRHTIVPVNAAGAPLGGGIGFDVAPTAEAEEVICTFPNQAPSETGSEGDRRGAPGQIDLTGGGEGEGAGGDGIEVSIENPKELGNYATNSGSILDSFFLDGGQGDVGINIYKSVLTGVNFSTSHQGGSNSNMTGSGNTASEAVSGNSPTNTNTPSYSNLDISTPVTVNGTIGPDTAVGVGDSSQGSSAPSSNSGGKSSDSGATSSTSKAPAAAPQSATSPAAPPAGGATGSPPDSGGDDDSEGGGGGTQLVPSG